MIVQNISADGHTDLTFTVSRGDLDRAVALLEGCRGAVGDREGAGKRDVERGGLRVGRGAEGIRRAREHLAPGEELGVGFEADDDFPASQGLPRLISHIGPQQACKDKEHAKPCLHRALDGRLRELGR